jgi:putative DNA primase/helicase
MSEVLEAALGYAGLKWPVFPAPPTEKKSYKSAAYSGGRRWGATTDPDEIRLDFARHKHPRIGVVMGAESGLVVVEIDTIEGHGVDGAASLLALEQAHAPLPDTLQAVSPSGSIHRYLKHPGAAIKIVCSASKLGPGVDVKGDAGMVIAPPSWSPGKGHYRWLNNSPVAQMPDWLVELTRHRPPLPRTISRRAVKAVVANVSGQQRLRGLVRAVLQAPDHQRNSVLHWAACRAGEMIADGSADFDFTFAALAEAARVVGLEHKEIGPTVASGIRKGCTA